MRDYFSENTCHNLLMLHLKQIVVKQHKEEVSFHLIATLNNIYRILTFYVLCLPGISVLQEISGMGHEALE